MPEKKKRSKLNAKQNTIIREKPGGKKSTKESSSSVEIMDIRNTPIKPEKAFPVVGVGASAGGLEAFEKFITNMPPDSGMAFILVMHFDPTTKSLMRDILKRLTKMEVFQAENNMKIKPNCVYVIPPNRDMNILHGTLHLLKPVIRHGVRHSIDFFFRYLAEDQKEKAIGIILSGAGTDGTLGLRAIKNEGGLAIVQDLKTAAYDSMPRNAIATALADYILPPEKMPEKLVEYAKRYYDAGKTGIIISESEDALARIVTLIQKQLGYDFSLYKQNMVSNRIEKRMNVHQIDSTSDYIRFLQENPHEVEMLFKELLIGVTSFFRDSEAFEVLKKEVIPDMLKNRTNVEPLEPVRIWVPACSSGEEAYSIAMIFKEYMEETKDNFNVQVFATDVDKESIEIARQGVYSAGIVADVSQERLQRFFISSPENTYRINEKIREMVIFAVQDVIQNPPFSKIDLISCRNLLIYLDIKLQIRLLSLFYSALNPGGFIFLGGSETISKRANLYSTFNRKWKFYKRKEGAAVPLMADLLPMTQVREPLKIKIKEASGMKRKEISVDELAKKLLIEDYAPASIIITEKGDILYFYGKTWCARK